MRIYLFVIFILLVNNLLGQEARLLRFPAIHGDKVVFSYAGDLYAVNSSGGVARKITNHNGQEIFARFSPDGKTLAFTGQYDGNSEIYTMPSEGGVPTRISFTPTLVRDDVSDRMGPNNICMTWQDNETVVFRTRSTDWNDWRGQLFLQKTNGETPQQLPLPYGGFCSYSPDKSKMAYNRIFREFRTWKRYKGGQADEIWIFDFKTKQVNKITDNTSQDIIPMWVGNKIYYLSDRDARMNLFCYDLTSKATKKITDFKDFDVKFPSASTQNIVFEQGGYIYKLDVNTDKYERLSIRLQEDFAIGRNKYVNVKDNIESWELGTDGNRALFVARGDIFTVPAKNGLTRNLTNTSNAHERSAVWSPNGKFIAYISDATGEDEVYIMESSANAKPVQLTRQSDNYKYSLSWSPDSKKIAFSNRKQEVYYVDINNKETTLIIANAVGEIRDYNWSPDSKYLTYTNPVAKSNSVIHIYNLKDKKNIAVTESWFDSYSPTFSSDGKYLYFISQRTFNPSYNNVEWNYAYFDLAKIYFLTLRKDIKSPFEPKSDEVGIKEETKEEKKEEKKEDKKQEGKKTDEKKPDTLANTTIDFANIINRIGEIPSPAGNYFSVQAIGDKVYFIKSSVGNKTKMYLYDISAQKETEIGEISNFSFSGDNKKMMTINSGNYYIVDAPSAKLTFENPLNLSEMKCNIDRKEEWKQIYNECWRQMRDFFYDPNMHGVNWKELRDNYATLLPYVNQRQDLSYIIGELIGELNCGHAYVGGGDYVKADRVNIGVLGAKLVRDPSGYYKIANIYKGQNWDKTSRSPLTEIGVIAKTGDYIISINGMSTKDVNNINKLLVATADKQVRLTINTKPSEEGAWTTNVIPANDEQQLIYYNWVQENHEKVTKATNGRVGYLHIPNMGSQGLNEFVKYFYAQLSTEALIVDDRGNGGGNVSPHIIERLRREPVQVTRMRNSTPSYEPFEQIIGPKVALLDEWSASDGDIFAYRFRKHKLGTIIGKRSWGGVVGIRGTLPIVDGGYLNRPEFGRYDVDGKQWEIEGHGVDPDIVVDNDPTKLFNGEDQQLNKAIQVILESMGKKSYREPVPPPYPVK